MGTQRPVMIGEAPVEDLGAPVAEHHGKNKPAQRSPKGGGGQKVKDKIKLEKFKKEEIVKEESTRHAQSDEGGEPEKKEETKENQPEKEKLKKTKVGKAKIRSSNYQKVTALIEKGKIYDLSSALEQVKKTSLTKFDGNVEVHLRLLSKTGKPENVRGTLKFPHEIGKKINVVILDEKKITQIKTTKKIDFDIALATPKMMPQVGQIAKILGPKGKMPNPKSGTITEDPEKTIKELAEGLVEYKTDAYGIIHQIIGKVSAKDKDLEVNFEALLNVVPREKIASLYVCATMGPSVKVALK